MNKKILFVIAIAFGLTLGAPVRADWVSVYEGALSTPDSTGGLEGTGGWETESSMSWEVGWFDDGADAKYWTYEYTFDMNHKEISHFILELSSDFDKDVNFKVGPTSGLYGGGGELLTDYSLDTFSESDGNSNPNLPSDLYGVKINLDGVSNSFSFWFGSDRDPVWGDVYLKDGNNEPKTTLWNTGFQEVSDTDPGDAPSSGSVGNHVLVANGSSDGHVPSPSALVGLLSMCGMGLAGWFVRRRR